MALIPIANDGNVAAQDALVKRYHWSNFSQFLLMEMDMERWKDVETRAKSNYQMAYTYEMRFFLDQEEERRSFNHRSKIKAYIQEQAEAGKAAYQNLMGLLERNTSRISARDWYEKSAAQGFAPGQVNLGLIHLMNEEYEKAFDLMMEAAQQGDNQTNLFLIFAKVVMDEEGLTAYGFLHDRDGVLALLEGLFKGGRPKGSLKDIVVQHNRRLLGDRPMFQESQG